MLGCWFPLIATEGKKSLMNNTTINQNSFENISYLLLERKTFSIPQRPEMKVHRDSVAVGKDEIKGLSKPRSRLPLEQLGSAFRSEFCPQASFIRCYLPNHRCIWSILLEYGENSRADSQNVHVLFVSLFLSQNQMWNIDRVLYSKFKNVAIPEHITLNVEMNNKSQTIQNN